MRTGRCFGEAMKHIAFFQRDFQVGGIQKALVNILENLDYSRCAVDVYVFDDQPFYTLTPHENLRVIECRPWPYVSRFVRFELARRLFQAVRTEREYDVAVDFNSYSAECAAGALSVRAKKRVIWIHNDMRIKYAEEPKYRLLWHFFQSKFRHFDAFAAVSAGIVDGFRSMTGLADAEVTVVPNFIDTGEIFRRAEEEPELLVDETKYNLCSMGRLVHQKGFDLLLDDFAKVRAARSDMHLTLIGDGPERQALEAQITRLGLSDCVTMTGNLRNPFPLLKRMDGFALESRYEGQGIVLWEAKALGLELFMHKRLEPYNPELTGVEDMVSALIAARKREKRPDDLHEYNEKVAAALEQVLF